MAMTSETEKPWWRGDYAVETYKTLGIAFFFFLFMPTLLFQPFRIPSSSMEGTLEVGDYLFVSKFTYGYSQYSFPFFTPVAFAGRVMDGPAQRGDVVVFRLPSDPTEDYIKRVVGVAGDRVQMIGGVLHINGEPVKLEKISDRIENAEDGSEQHVRRYNETLPGGVTHVILKRFDGAQLDDTEEFVVPPGNYFMMGDNRDNSNDSRASVGFVPEQNLVGRAEVVFFSHDGSAELWEVWKWPFAIRYSRLLNLIG
ncbi:MAG: signal peptidase I [Alphaproteobacteria bacterium]|nr:signal peptidase I [Alphaproteobacteria bacterium]